jgi:hypothetical protein
VLTGRCPAPSGPAAPGIGRSADAPRPAAPTPTAGPERALVTNRRIGIAVGVLVCRLQLTAEQAIDRLNTQSQHRNVTVRDLAETVIHTGTL